MGLHEKALECFCIDLNHINNADDFKASYLYQKGLTLFYLNRYLEAIDQFDKSLSINIHQNGLSHNMKALSLMEIGDLDSALFFINQAINNNSQNSAIRFNKALILIKLENLQEALIALDDAIQIDMNNVNFYNNKGWVLEKLGNLESAKQNYYLALEKNPQSSIIYFNLANVLFKLKDYQESLHICDLAIQRNLKSAQIYSCKGQIFFIWSQMDEVKKNFENAFLEPSCSDNEYRQFAQILFQKNDLKNALKYIEIAISRNSENNDNFMVQAEIVNSIQRECQRNENHQ
ncbi:unnamed protein product [Paramecium sonneborni]|uniref:Tetratricopeptide repeat protein n=1 Tax=Paramecium sonneborni TaxID=65129 RepID=A0A8S1RD35_9CILI|nr:unnamed protein product [Paramecium sonneborni]